VGEIALGEGAVHLIPQAAKDVGFGVSGFEGAEGELHSVDGDAGVLEGLGALGVGEGHG